VGEKLLNFVVRPGSERVIICPSWEDNMGDIEDVSGDRVSEVLRQQLGPEFISTRRGAGKQELSYLTGCDAIRIANAVFGFNGWSSEVRRIDVIYCNNEGGRWSAGASVNVRITLLKYDGVFREDLGYGQAIKLFSQLEAVEKAGKEAQTDALKRALRQFGEVTGNCMYDKKYLSQIGKHRRDAGDVVAFDVNSLFHLGKEMTAIVQKRGPVNGGSTSKFLGLGDESKGVKRVRNGDGDEDDKFGERAGKKLGECVLRFVSSEDDADICK
jgi:DNA repair and recombination protein RAD52